MSREIHLDPAGRWQAATDHDGMLRAMAELLLSISIKNEAQSIEFRTIENEFRIAMLDDDGAHEFPQPPPEGKAAILAHCRRLSGLETATGFTTVAIIVGDGRAIADVESDPDNVLWKITGDSTQADAWKTLLDDFWNLRNAERPWHRRTAFRLKDLWKRFAGEPEKCT